MLGRATPSASSATTNEFGPQMVNAPDATSVQAVQQGHITNDYRTTNYLYAEKKSSTQDSATPEKVALVVGAVLISLSAITLASLGTSITPILVGFLAGSATWILINMWKSRLLSDHRVWKFLPAVATWILALACTVMFLGAYNSKQPDGRTISDQIGELTSPDNIALIETFKRIIVLFSGESPNTAFTLLAFILLIGIYARSWFYNLTWTAQIAASTRAGTPWLEKLGRFHNSRGIQDLIGLIFFLLIFIWFMQDSPIQLMQDFSQQIARWIEALLI